jgi:hypothetical protein
MVRDWPKHMRSLNDLNDPEPYFTITKLILPRKGLYGKKVQYGSDGSENGR